MEICRRKISEIFPIVLFLWLSWAACEGLVPGKTINDPFGSSPDKEFTGSPPLLQSLAGKEEVIYMLLKDLKTELVKQGNLENSVHSSKTNNSVTHQLQSVERYIKDFESTTGQVRGNFTKENVPFRAYHVAWNPVASYHMIRRFAKDLKQVLETMDENQEDSFRAKKMILSIMDGMGWPSEEDIKASINGILRVQNVYNLETEEIAEGKIHGHDTNVRLGGEDCHEIGKHGLAAGTYTWAIEWLEKAKALVTNDPAVNASAILEDLKRAVETHDEAWDKAEKWEHVYYVDKVSKVPTNRIKRRKIQFETYKGGKTSNLNEINFWGLCDGENYQSPEEKKRLFCWVETKRSPYLTIAPVKSELLSTNPVIVQYHDVIGPQMIARIKREAAPHLRRSTVVDERNGGSITSKQRTSLNTWVADYDREEYKSIPRTITAITGLRTDNAVAAEELQVASYAFGGHYEVHMDAMKFTRDTNTRGDRIATFMYYLSDVEEGGATAFPMVGVAARPIKGSAVYWNNILSSGFADERTWHGACPVILGEKWVANKWIRMHEQFSVHKCHPKNHPVPYEINGVPMKF